MDNTKFSLISTKVKNLEQEVARAEGMQASLLNNLKVNHGCETTEQAKEKLVKLQDDLKVNNERVDELFGRLEGLTDWNKV